jgi:hypothetical protein
VLFNLSDTVEVQSFTGKVILLRDKNNGEEVVLDKNEMKKLIKVFSDFTGEVRELV